MSITNEQVSTQEMDRFKKFDIELTSAQSKALQKLLPKGYTLEQISHPKKRDPTPKPTKKIVTNDGKAVPVKPVPPMMKQPSIVDAGTPTSDLDLNRKVSLREKKKSNAHLAHKYPDFDTPATKHFKPQNEGVKKCLQIINKLKKHRYSEPFLRPVDVEGLGLFDYYQVIAEPMDLGTVENKLKAGEYIGPNEMINDIRKVWENAMTYNRKGSEIWMMSNDISNYFEKQVPELQSLSFNNDTIKSLEKQVERLTKKISEYGHKGGKMPGHTKTKANMERDFTNEEKKVLGENIRSLPPEQLRGVWDIVSEHVGPTNGDEEICFDLDTLPAKVLRELEKYVKNKINQLNRAQKKKGKESISSRQSFNQQGAGYPQDMGYQQHYQPQGYDPYQQNQQPMSMGGMPQNGGHYTMPNQHYQQPMGSMQQNYMQPQSYQAQMEQLRQSTNQGAVMPDHKGAASSESSFISDSNDGSDDDDDQKKKAIHHQRSQELANFQAGGHGSMLNNFVVK